MEIFVLPLIAIALIVMPLVIISKKHKNGTLKSPKKALAINLASFFGALALFTILPLGGFVGAEAADAVQAATAGSEGLKYIAAALSTGLGSIGTGIAVAAAAPAAIGATSEDGKNFSKAMVFVAMGEGVAIYGLLISILILFV